MRFAVASAALAVCTALFVLALLGSSQGALALDTSAVYVTAVTVSPAAASEPMLKVDPEAAAVAIACVWILGGLLAASPRKDSQAQQPSASA